MPLSVMGFAVYSPAGRMTDFFGSRAACPRPGPYRNWRTADMEIQEQWVGEMSSEEARKFFALANPAIYDPEACRTSEQQRFRDRVIASGYDLLADVPQRWPAE